MLYELNRLSSVSPARRASSNRPILAAAAAISWLVLLGTAGVVCAQEVSPATKPPAVEVKTHAYKTTPQGELVMDVYRASDATADSPRPAIVFFFGGGWKKGQRSQFKEQAEYLASRGLIAATADYRIATKHMTLPDAAVADAFSAVRWLRANARELGIDPLRIAAGGGSAGGHIAACTALLEEPQLHPEDIVKESPEKNAAPVSARPNALVLFNPVLDLKTLPIPGKTPSGDELVEALSPIRFVRDDLPPTILFYGTEDKFLEGAERYQEKVQRHKGRCELQVAEGQGHSFFNKQPWKGTTLRAADEFLGSLGWLAGPPTVAAPPSGFGKLVKSNVQAATETRSSD